MPLHLPILRKSDNYVTTRSGQKPPGLHKRRRTTSTEISAVEDDPTIQVLQDTMDWREVIVDHNSSLKEQTEALSKRSTSFSSADKTELSEDEMSSLYSLMEEQTEGFESGFASFDAFMNYSSSSLDDEQAITNEKVATKKSKSKIKRKLKKLKRKIKTTLKGKANLKRIRKIAKSILRASAIVFRGVLFLTINVLIVLAIIISLAI